MSKTVFVLGELNIDAILSGLDIQPEPNKEKLIDNFEITLGSSSAITACRLAQLGMEVNFVSIVGNDLFGSFCIERLNHFGVKTDFVIVEEREKTGVTVSISGPKDRALLTFMGTIHKLKPTMIPEEMFELADHVHFGSYNLQDEMRPHWEAIFRKAKEKGMTTSFDTGWDPRENLYREQIGDMLRYTDFFIPSESEIQHIYNYTDLTALPGLLASERGKIVIKRGKDGASMLKPSDEWIHAAGFPVVPVDTTGAGDSFNAGIIYGALTGMNEERLLAFANACGALSTEYIGGTGGIIDVEKVLQFMDSR